MGNIGSAGGGPPPPNYASVEAWWCITPLDGGANPAGWVPGRAPGGSPTAAPFIDKQASSEDATVDVFYVHPTTAWHAHGHTGTGNVKLDAASQITMHTVGGHASAFSSVGRIFAPKYRQAKVDNFRTWGGDPHAEPHADAFDLAYTDVRAAFVEYVKTWSEGGSRGLILASHSQGSMHLTRLLVELRDGHAKGKGMYGDEHVPFDESESETLAVCQRVLREQVSGVADGRETAVLCDPRCAADS